MDGSWDDPNHDGTSSWHPALRPDDRSPQHAVQSPAVPSEGQKEGYRVTPLNGSDNFHHEDSLKGPASQEPSVKISSLVESDQLHQADDRHHQERGNSERKIVDSLSHKRGDSDFYRDVGRETDPAWGMAPDSARFDRLSFFNHTNSFPEVPPQRETPPSNLTELPRSMAAEIVEYEGHIVDEEDDNGARVETSWSVLDQDNEFASGADEDLFTRRSHIEQANATTPPEIESRFEEGLPLVLDRTEIVYGDNHELTETKGTTIPASEDMSRGNDDFIAQSQSPSHQGLAKATRQLDRKSTAQVLSSMSFAEVDQDDEDAQPAGTSIHWGDNGSAAESLFSGAKEDEFFSTQLNDPKQQPESALSQKEDLDALWKAALDEDELLDEEPQPNSFLGDDGGDLLEDIPGNQLNKSHMNTAPPPQPQPRYQPQQPTASLSRPTSTSQFAPSTLFQATHQQSISRGAAVPATTFRYGNYGQRPDLRPGAAPKAESFADKSKGGYASPYDLPTDIALPKRRPVQPSGNNTQGGAVLPPPPRSSSIPPGPQVHASSLSGVSKPLPPVGMSGAPAVPNQGTKSSFFEELPAAPRTRTTSNSSRFTPAPYQHGHSPPLFPTHPTQGLTPSSSVPQSSYNLVQPGPVLPYTDAAHPVKASQPAPPKNTRYSPAPAAQPLSNDQNRYASTVPSGPPRAPSISQVLHHQPRTSSPLSRTTNYTPQPTNTPPIGTTGAPPSTLSPPKSYPTRETQSVQPIGGSSTAMFAELNLQSRTGAYAPNQADVVPSRVPDVPKRSQTQSPGSLMSQSRPHVQRRKSIDDPTSPSLGPIREVQSQPSEPSQVPNRPRAPSNKQPPVQFIAPNDERREDLLERWKGCPIFSFSFGGNIVSSIPKQVPRYQPGQRVPLMYCTAGEVKILSGMSMPLSLHVSAFPGPLRAKGKKKDVLDWLQQTIFHLKQEQSKAVLNNIPPELHRKQDEKVLLWEIVRLLVEHDGALDGGSTARKAIQHLLSPELNPSVTPRLGSFGSTTFSVGITAPSVAREATVSSSFEAVEDLRKLLLQGEREKAVWQAVDQRIWGHAMLLASTQSPDLWKQVVQDFIRNEVKTVGNNTEALAALYSTFAGDWEDSVDHLVPPSARAGLQMLSKSDVNIPTRNALSGLDRWRETLNLMLNNRSSEDSRAMVALGQLLATYGRVEAAHICYLFAKIPAMFGGSDDPQAGMTLLGADHRAQPFDYSRDLDSILLSEVYEFVLITLMTPPTAAAIPHLQGHKLYHAMVLAENGFRDRALAYCDSIATAIRSTTKISLYHHPQLIEALEDLGSRLRQAPREGSSSWIPRPSLDKVSGTVWNRFTSFVAGEDNDAASVSSSQAAADGPFARVSPSISRSQSPNEQFVGTSNGDQNLRSAPVPIPANTRYAPAGKYAPSSAHKPSVASVYSQSPSQAGSLPKSGLSQQYEPRSAYAPSDDDMGRKLSTSSHSPDATRNLRNQSPYMRSPSLTSQQYNDNSRPGTGYAPNPLLSPPSQEFRRPSSDIHAARNYAPSPVLSDRGRSYAPRSAGPGPRNYAPSPVGEKPLPNPPDSASYEPTAPPESHDAPTNSVSNEDSELSRSQIPSDELVTTENANAKSAYQPSRYDPPPSLPNAGPEEYKLSEKTPASTFAPSSYEPSVYMPNESNEAPSSSFNEYLKKDSYDPPTQSFGYEPPSYDAESSFDRPSPANDVPRKKHTYDLSDDEDLPVLKGKQKANGKSKTDLDNEAKIRAIAEAEEKAIAEARAAKGGGWLGWAFGGKPKEDKTKAIKVKMGEELSMVYDKDLKKWVPKAGSGTAVAAEASQSTPPPPRIGPPPSRTASAVGGPPSRPPTGYGVPGASRLPSGTPPPMASTSGASPKVGGPTSNLPGDVKNTEKILSPPLPGAGPAGLGVSGLNPPSRPGTGMSGISTASEADDIMGSLQPRKGGTVKRGKKGGGRYIDVIGDKK